MCRIVLLLWSDEVEPDILQRVDASYRLCVFTRDNSFLQVCSEIFLDVIPEVFQG